MRGITVSFNCSILTARAYAGLVSCHSDICTLFCNMYNSGRVKIALQSDLTETENTAAEFKALKSNNCDYCTKGTRKSIAYLKYF
jgi:hypothetical protein